MCEAAKERLQEIGCQPSKIESWNLPIDLDAYPYTPRHKLTKRIKALTCARFVEKKGYPTLLNAIAVLRQEGIDVELHALGYGGDFQLLADLSKTLKIDDLVVWHRDYTGDRFRMKYMQLLEASDVFLFAAERAKNGDDEGGPPLSVISAQATGIPIISSKFTGYEITIEQGVTGFLCEKSIEESMILYIKSFIRDPQTFFSVGVAGANRARQEFDFDRQSDKLVELLMAASNRK
jgi:colanic acid/amylovoran biosynthesis glycosyltransferase